MKTQGKSKIKKGDTVMVIAGGNKKTKPLKGQTGKVLQVIDGENGQRVVVEGLNLVTHAMKKTAQNKPSGLIKTESPIHVSNVMYYAEKIKKPVVLKTKMLADGKKVRGYIHPENGSFEQI